MAGVGIHWDASLGLKWSETQQLIDRLVGATGLTVAALEKVKADPDIL